MMPHLDRLESVFDSMLIQADDFRTLKLLTGSVCVCVCVCVR
jgi:hypothetical protein